MVARFDRLTPRLERMIAERNAALAKESKRRRASLRTPPRKLSAYDKARQRAGRERLENFFDRQLTVLAPDLPEPVGFGGNAQLKVVEGRRLRFDRAWPGALVAVEINGGTWSGGRHTRGAGFERDCEKRCYAAAAGWALFELTTSMLKDRKWIEMVIAAVRARSANHQL